METAEDIRALFTTLYQLKQTPRTGWVDRGIPLDQIESVADHSLFTCLISYIVACNNDNLDIGKVTQLALIHDVAEAISGDIPPYDPAEIPANADDRRAFFAVRRTRTPENASRKHTLESEAAEKLLTMLPARSRSAWSDLWQEYEAQESTEAQLVKQVDRLEAFIQSRLYSQRFPDVPLDGFTDMARQSISHPLLVPIRDAFLPDAD